MDVEPSEPSQLEKCEDEHHGDGMDVEPSEPSQPGEPKANDQGDGMDTAPPLKPSKQGRRIRRRSPRRNHEQQHNLPDTYTKGFKSSSTRGLRISRKQQGSNEGDTILEIRQMLRKESGIEYA